MTWETFDESLPAGRRDVPTLSGFGAWLRTFLFGQVFSQADHAVLWQWTVRMSACIYGVNDEVCRDMYVNVFLSSCLDSAVSLTRVREQRFTRSIYYYENNSQHPVHVQHELLYHYADKLCINVGSG